MKTVADVLANLTPWACDTGHALPWLRSLPSASVHCWVSSPPYYGLRSYLPKDHPDKALEIGMEKTPAEFVASLVAVFGEARRVLHPSGALWVNIGDSYSAKSRTRRPSATDGFGKHGKWYGGTETRVQGGEGIKPKDLIGVPWLLAFALRDAGWHLRAECIWSKTNPMPESVTDRPGKAHESVFLLANSSRPYYDAVAVRQPGSPNTHARSKSGKASHKRQVTDRRESMSHGRYTANEQVDGRNLRTVWTASGARFKGAHFAVMPDAIVRPCVLAGTSEKGCCPKCLAPWVRQVKRERVATRPALVSKVTGDRLADGNRDPERHVTRVETTGWKPSCSCEAGDPIPCVVGDPFAGAGTVLKVAVELGRRAVGCDLDPKCLDLIRGRMPVEAA